MKFVGIDLAWKVRPAPNEKRTAIVALDEGGRVIFYDHCSNDEEIIGHVDKQAEGKCIVGIDAPLVVPIITRGRRDCEAYGKLKLHVYPTDPHRFEKWYGGCRGVVIVKKLQDLNHGFFLVDQLPDSIEKAVVEVYPTGSWMRLFGRVPKFKRVRVEKKRRALLKLKDLLKSGMPPQYPPVDLDTLDKTGEDLEKLAGLGLDMYGDAPDAIMSAYTVLLWAKKPGLCEVVGNLGSGFILLPLLPLESE